MTSTSTATAPARCSRQAVPAPRTPLDQAAADELARLQDTAAARSWAAVDHRRPRRPRH